MENDEENKNIEISAIQLVLLAFLFEIEDQNITIRSLNT